MNRKISNWMVVQSLRFRKAKQARQLPIPHGREAEPVFQLSGSACLQSNFHAAGAHVKENGKNENDAAHYVLIRLPDAHKVHAVLERG